VACTAYILPSLSAGNTYWTQPGGTGTQLFAGDAIASSQTVYIYAQSGTTPNCVDESDFVVSFGSVTADVLNDQTVCDSFILPALSANNAYWTGPGASGTQLFAGDAITQSMTVYIWAAVDTCTDQSTFVVTVNPTPVLAPVSDQTACDSYALPALSVGSYFDAPGGTGNALSGNITQSMTVYVYAQTGTTPNCFAEASFQVTINTTPSVDDLQDVSICEGASYTLPVLASGAYYTQPGGAGSQLQAGDEITTTQTVFIWASNGTCSDQTDFTVLVTPVPAFTIESGCQGSQYVLTVVPANGFDPDVADYTWSAAGAGVITGSGQSVVVSGEDTYSVTVSLGDCQTTLPVEVDGTGCLIQKGISPNGDGNNDYFDLEGQNVTRLQIFNRYGMVVYKRDNYTNQWGGQSDDGEELPDGTYYYVIDRAAGESKTGWIYINRNRN
jgi:gliding motility-associated-like protein